MNDIHYLPRALGSALESCLRAFPVVILTGARQTGKTTLVRHLPSATQRAFRSLDDLRVLEQAQREPDLLVREAERLTLDEVQRQPDLLRAIKRAVDERRLPGRFLLTGSANLLLMRQVSETLAGRAVYLRLSPLSEAEKLGAGRFGAWDLLLGAASAQEAEAALSSRAATEFTWSAAAYEGGYPPVLSLGETDRARWLEGYVTTYLERDLQQLASITELADFRRFLQVAAGRLGGIVNRADLARDADLSRPTAHRYLNLLDVSFQTRLLPAYAASRTTRLVKSPKLYWTDTGLAAYLAGFASAEEVRQDPRRGPLLENLILKEIDAWRESATPKPEVYYWRTAGGLEVDFVFESRRRLLPVEVKAASRARLEDAAAITKFLHEYRAAHWGCVLHTGADLYRLSDRLLAVPLGRVL